ncbi:MAG: hypothetical protein ACR2KL_04430 [Nocardioidaceae bacterium]
MTTSTLTSPARHTAVKSATGLALLGSLGVLGVILAPSASADVDGIGTGAVADYSCSDHTVYVEPFSVTPLDGNWPIWSQAQVYDYATGQWITSGWIQADGITNLTFSVTSPYSSAYVTFAHDAGNGDWHYDNQWVDITDDLDNAYPFC